MGRVEDKIALVTGAASGFGRTSAILLAREWAKVAVTDINGKGAQKTLDANNWGYFGRAIF